VIWGSTIIGADLHARHARDEAKKAAREADRAEAYAWSVCMEGYGGPVQPSPTIGQCSHGGLGWLEVECKDPRKHAVERNPPTTRYADLEAWLNCRSCGRVDTRRLLR
jgi:hypothetical protein